MLLYSNMIINRLVRIKLLLLFVLLQCVAPLAHAHVNGHHADHKLHIDSVDFHGMNAHNCAAAQLENLQLSAEQHHSAVISMPPEYRNSDLSIAQPVINNQNSLLFCEYVDYALAAPELQSLPLPPYQHPCSQAPPA